MKNIVIITPVYNDWESFTKLINEIDKTILSFKDISFKLIAVNDGSRDRAPILQLPPKIKTVEILNMKKNQGHAICLANGIKYALKNYEFDNLILMDADGEDRPKEIFGGKTTIHSGKGQESYILLPIIPERKNKSVKHDGNEASVAD